jgi:tetratricopeptide (TPR) repeat protein
MADTQRIEDLRRRVQKDPASIAFAQLAEECRRAGHYQEAVDVCRTGLELHPGYLSARVTLGRALIELNDLDLALAELQYVLKAAPENLAAIRGVAEIYHRQDVLPEALAQYRAALVLARNDPDLQRTVDELARKVEPLPPPASADGLSFEQMQNEFLQNLPLPPPPPVKALEPEPQPAALETVPDAAPAAPLLLLAPAVEFETVPVEESPNDAAGSKGTQPTSDIPAAFAPDTRPAPDAAAWPPADTAAPDSADTAERDRSHRLIVVLEQWLDAVHVARAQLRA